MNTDKLKELLVEFGSNVIFEQDLKKKNWFNIGGKSKVFYKANNLKELISFIKKLENKERVFILGAGSNTLITKNFNNISLLNDDILIAGGAVLDKSLSDFAIDNDLSGFEFLSCIPGTIGGGIRMNAGCFGREFKDILISIQAIDKLGNIITIPSKDINFDYRKNNLSEDLIFLSASFKGKKSSRTKILEETNKLKFEKDKNQPTKIKTSGSTFKNPINQTKKKVWELIKESVPPNQSFGDAYISEKHCNFFVNKGNAKFEDMKKLIDYVSKRVLEKTGISLEKEIKILE
jgi:UDP-N-acetylmuramate dehydrogenase